MQNFVAIESSSGRVFFIQNVKDAEEAYRRIGIDIYEMPEPIDAGNVDVDLYQVPGNYGTAVICTPVV